MIALASLHPAQTRLAVATVVVVLFGAVAVARWERPVPAVPVALLCVIVVGWLFGATLVWGDPFASKVRIEGGWTNDPGAWEWQALLAVAIGGCLSLGASLRAYAHGKTRAGVTLASIAGAAFLVWSLVVNSTDLEITAGVVAIAAIASIGRSVAALEPASTRAGNGRNPASIPLLLGAVVIGAAWAVFAFAWLVVGPEGHPGLQSCGCWADMWDSSGYTWQFLIAVVGALALVAGAIRFARGRTGLLSMPNLIALSSACAWIALWLIATE